MYTTMNSTLQQMARRHAEKVQSCLHPEIMHNMANIMRCTQQVKKCTKDHHTLVQMRGLEGTSRFRLDAANLYAP